MLDIALKYQKVFERLGDEDKDYVAYFKKISKCDNTHMNAYSTPDVDDNMDAPNDSLDK